jgi:hypothetical protein
VAKIIRLDTSRKKPKEKAARAPAGCEHKNVVVYERYRTVRCALCRALLDPFDVLLDMVKGYIPPERENKEEARLDKEEAKRGEEPDDDNPPTFPPHGHR